jgi:DNA-binding NarL/FixJ family response regulator
VCISVGTEGDLIKELREASPKAQALVLSAILDRRETAGAVEAGCAGVLSKTANLERVIYAVRRLRAGAGLRPAPRCGGDTLRSSSNLRELEVLDVGGTRVRGCRECSRTFSGIQFVRAGHLIAARS